MTYKLIANKFIISAHLKNFVLVLFCCNVHIEKILIQ